MFKVLVKSPFFRKLVVWGVVVARIFTGILIFFQPLNGFIWFSIVDFWDAYFLQHMAGMSWMTYQKLDKKLDWFGYVSMLLVGIKFGIASMVIPFFLFKLLGQIVFMFFKQQKVFLFFPNFLEAIFLWAVIFPLMGLSGRHLSLVFDQTLLALFALEIVKEFFLHVFWPNYLKKNGFPNYLRIFGIGKEVNWG